MTPQKPHPAVPTLGEAEAAGNILDVDVDQQLLGESAGGDSLPDFPLPDVLLPDVPLRDVPLADVPLADVPLPDIPLPDAPPPGACLEGSVLEVRTSPRIAEEMMVSVFGLQLGSCLVRFLWSNQYISGIDYYTRRKVFG